MLLEPTEYKIVVPVKPELIKPENTFHPERQVKFSCKECESIIYVKEYDDIVKMGKTCTSCRNKKTAELRSETIKNNGLFRNPVKCNSCNTTHPRKECVNAAFLKCPSCGSFDMVEIKNINKEVSDEKINTSS